ncbi:predicted protein [Uncinocarpus reesii 1704]|uniref:Uncharacterized protein n=1 Tax=Uncinocarpus reesii (strain UAMH 1704) TaxID=336963 RepID=C4JF89_UNCRE|nr:uncharacterized protein UREG_02311 [Uncinocarpus reesii 1704]EEP77462.1 predicted protein [Uncinocarpus reesii 1704]
MGCHFLTKYLTFGSRFDISPESKGYRKHDGLLKANVYKREHFQRKAMMSPGSIKPSTC